MKIGLAIILSATLVGTASAQSLFERAKGFFLPAPEFAGLKVNAKLNTLTRLGFSCSEFTEIESGKIIKGSACEDNSYRAEVFGINYIGREVIFIDGNLAIIKIKKLDPAINAVSHAVTISNLHNKLDTALKRESRTKDGRAKWDFGAGSTLIVDNPPPLHYLRQDRVFAMILLTSDGGALLDQ